MFNSEQLQEKWQPVLEHADLPEIKDAYKKAVTTVILENQERAMSEDRAFLSEAAPTNDTGSEVQNWDPILISLIRRSMPNLIAYDICGVQPMSGPTGLIFAMKSRYTNQSGTEAFMTEADTDFSADNVGSTLQGNHTGSDVLSDMSAHITVSGMTTAQAEALGDGTSNNNFAEMAFSIDKVTVTAVSRALKAEYTMELAQDLKAIHGLDAETELANILSSEILAEINREVVRTIYSSSKSGAQTNVANAGIFDLDTDSNGRWSVEKFKGMMFQIERDANVIAQDTRRGKGNILICDADVASALSMAGMLDNATGLSNNLNVDDTGSTFAGTLNGRFKVFVDPYANNSTATKFFVVGYKGTSPYDAGLFYCPYVPLQMVRAVGEQTFQPKIGFKTRYGMVANPFATTDGDGGIDLTNPGSGDRNMYYRRVQVANLM